MAMTTSEKWSEVERAITDVRAVVRKHFSGLNDSMGEMKLVSEALRADSLHHGGEVPRADLRHGGLPLLDKDPVHNTKTIHYGSNSNIATTIATNQDGV